MRCYTQFGIRGVDFEAQVFGGFPSWARSPLRIMNVPLCIDAIGSKGIFRGSIVCLPAGSAAWPASSRVVLDEEGLALAVNVTANPLVTFCMALQRKIVTDMCWTRSITAHAIPAPTTHG